MLFPVGEEREREREKEKEPTLTIGGNNAARLVGAADEFEMLDLVIHPLVWMQQSTASRVCMLCYTFSETSDICSEQHHN